MSTAGMPGPPDAEESRRPGRPRSQAVTDRLLDATFELLAEAGVEGTTIHTVAARAGVARATVYLRWANIEELIVAAIRHTMGRPPVEGSGDIAADLRAGAEQVRVVFASPAFQAVYPALVRAVLNKPTGRAAVTYDMLSPGRRIVADEYAALAGQQGMRTDLKPDLVVDLVIGGLVNHLLSQGRPPTKEEAQQAAEIVIAGVRRSRR
jgi:AcrR family transcriptional regulator